MTKPITDLESRLDASFKRVKNKAAVSLGSLGGKATAQKMTKEQLIARAKKAVQARIDKKGGRPRIIKTNEE